MRDWKEKAVVEFSEERDFLREQLAVFLPNGKSKHPLFIQYKRDVIHALAWDPDILPMQGREFLTNAAEIALEVHAVSVPDCLFHV